MKTPFEIALYNIGRQINMPLMVSGAVIIAIAGLLCLWLRKSYSGYERLQRVNASEKRFFRAMVALGVLFFLVYSYVSVWRWYKMLSGAWDLGIFWSLFENALDGRFFQDYRGPFDHFSPGLVLYLPFYALWRDARLLLVLQAAVVTIGVWPLYLLAKEVSGRAVLASVVGIVYLLYPFLGAGTVYDFHALSMTPVFFFAMLLFMVRRKWRWYWVFFALLLLVKESEAILSFGAGLYLLSRRKDPERGKLRIIGAITVVVSVAWFFGSTRWLLPLLSGGEYRHLGRYGRLPEVIKWALTTTEGRIHAAVYPARVIAVFVLTALPAGFFFLRRWRPFVLVFGPYFAVNICSTALEQNVFFGHYVLTLSAAVLASVALATRDLRGFEKDEDPSVWPVFLVVVAVLSNILYSWPANVRLYRPANHVYMDKSWNVLSLPLPLTEERRRFYTLDQHERFWRDIKGLFPKGSKIATQNSLGCYFAVGYELVDFKQETRDVEADFYLFDCGRLDSRHTPEETFKYLLTKLSEDPGTVEFINLYSKGERDFFRFFARGDKWMDFYRNLLAASRENPENQSYKIAIRAIATRLGIDRIAVIGLPEWITRRPPEKRPPAARKPTPQRQRPAEPAEPSSGDDDEQPTLPL